MVKPGSLRSNYRLPSDSPCKLKSVSMAKVQYKILHCSIQQIEIKIFMHEGLSLGPQSNKKVGYDGSVLIVTAMAYNHRWDGEKGKPL